MSDIELLTQRFITEVQKSHIAVSKSVSEFGSNLKELSNKVNDLHTNLIVTNEHIREIVEQNKVRNGRIEQCEQKDSQINEAVIALKTRNEETEKRISTGWIIAGIMVTVISSLIGAVYYSENEKVSLLTTRVDAHIENNVSK